MINKNSGYYEGVLQIRPNNEKVMDYIIKEIEKSGNVFISKEIVKKFGTDLYLTNKFFLVQLGRKLKSRFKGNITRSRTLHTRNRQTSREVYRTTICFRLLDENSE